MPSKRILLYWFGHVGCLLVRLQCHAASSHDTFTSIRAGISRLNKYKHRLLRAPFTLGRQSDSWFGKGRNFQVGDVIKVLLNESTQAARSQVGSISRNSTNDMLSPGLAVLGNKLGGVMKGTDFSKTDISNKGTGTADQTASLTGSVAVSVVEVMPNGNLVLRGEKQLALTEGSEIIQVAGIIRPDDVAPNNTVQSRRLANAQIAYQRHRRFGQCHARRLGHQRPVLKLWPF
jgi:flagellar L-ring protein FlgH